MSALADIAFPMRLSFQIASCATLAIAVLGVPLAWLLASREFRGRGLLDAALTLPMVLPPVVTGYYVLLVIGRNGLLGKLTGSLTGEPRGITFTWQAAVIASFAIALPLTVKTARAAIEQVDPALLVTAHTMGRGPVETALFVTLPLAARGILAGLALSFARALGEFGATIMVAGNIPGHTNTMALEIYNAVIYGDWGTATLLVVVFTAAAAAVLLLAGRLASAVSR